MVHRLCLLSISGVSSEYAFCALSMRLTCFEYESACFEYAILLSALLAVSLSRCLLYTYITYKGVDTRCFLVGVVYEL